MKVSVGPRQNRQEEYLQILAVTTPYRYCSCLYGCFQRHSKKAGEKWAIALRPETPTAPGGANILTKKEIEECDIIIAADKNVEMARSDGKPVIKASVTNGIDKHKELIQKIVDGKLPFQSCK